MSYLKENCLSIEVADVLIGKLSSIRNGNVDILGCGICANWNWAVEEVLGDKFISCYKLVQELALGWPDHSGDTVMPIPYNPNCHQWEGPNREARMGLCDYMLEQLVDYRSALC